ncbi:hypothetical protein [Streptomyces sp. HPF1205]|uniref:hypothetical protein n=1 Tax=Streptomyces sp. HPF1205 TaxID=2873262 RepID=UPI001CECBE47|nr:hypothetical protein [Streptomyces sp. HPF1205]
MTPPDIVYPVRPGDDNHELRYSLRSLANLPHGRVWIAGHMPPWVRGVGHIPVPPQPTKYLSSTANLRAAVEHPDIAEEFLYFNDDFFVMQPVEAMPVLHRGPLEQVERRCAHRATGSYAQGLRETRALLADLGHKRPLSYELHVPMPMSKTRARETLEAGQRLQLLHKRTLYGNLHQVGGRQIFDPKVLTRSPRFPHNAPFLSTAPDTFAAGSVGQFIRRQFAAPGPYEAGRS